MMPNYKDVVKHRKSDNADRLKKIKNKTNKQTKANKKPYR